MNTNISATSFPRMVCAVALVALTLGFSVVSNASGAPDEQTVTVEFVSASASTPQGARTLYRRIQGAAENVCSVLDHGDLSSKRHFRACVRATIEDAVRSLNRHAVTAAYEADYPPLPSEQHLAVQVR